MRRKKLLYFVPLGICAMALFILVGGEVVMNLWNWLLPPIFGWPAITFWQGLGLLALCRILFGGFGGRGFPRTHHLTPDERERLRQRFRDRVRERCGMGPAPTPSETPGQ